MIESKRDIDTQCIINSQKKTPIKYYSLNWFLFGRPTVRCLGRIHNAFRWLFFLCQINGRKMVILSVFMSSILLKNFLIYFIISVCLGSNWNSGGFSDNQKLFPTKKYEIFKKWKWTHHLVIYSAKNLCEINTPILWGLNLIIVCHN